MSSQRMERVLFKIVPADLWRASQAQGRFRGSPADMRDGFIHLSTAAQLRETARRHFAGQAGLLLVAVSGAALEGHGLRWEPSRGGDLFPHLYGELPMGAVEWVVPLPLDERGEHVFPGEEGERSNTGEPV